MVTASENAASVNHDAITRERMSRAVPSYFNVASDLTNDFTRRNLPLREHVRNLEETNGNISK